MSYSRYFLNGHGVRLGNMYFEVHGTSKLLITGFENLLILGVTYISPVKGMFTRVISSSISISHY